MSRLITIKNLSYVIPYGKSILENVNLEVNAGEFIGILGHNGSGKTTFIEMLLGNKKSSEGQIEVLDENPHSAERKNKSQIVYLSQDVSIKGDLTIGQFLKFHSAFYPDYSKEAEQYYLDTFELKRDLKVGALSTGQQKKVQIIANFSARPKLIIIDEITAVLDPETRDIFFKELLALRNNNGVSVLLATNLAEDLMGRANKVLFITNKSAELHDPETILHLFNIENAA